MERSRPAAFVVVTGSVLESLLLLGSALAAAAQQKYYTYIGDLSHDSALIAWGTTQGRGMNTIGRNSVSLGKAVVRAGAIEVTETNRNWVMVRNLSADSEYVYNVRIAGKQIGGGSLRT